MELFEQPDSEETARSSEPLAARMRPRSLDDYAGQHHILGRKGYKYAHDFEGHVVDQQYVPTEKIYYEPTEEGYEQRIRQRIERWRALKEQQRK